MDQDVPELVVMVLAAGGSERLGTPKQLLPINGTSLLQHALRECGGLVDSSLFVVIGAHAAQVAGELQDLDVELVHNANWQTGIASSVRAGLAALPETADGVLICLCDQPFVTRDELRALADLWSGDPNKIVASEYAGTIGVPAVFPSRLFPELAALKGDSGAKKVIDREVGKVSVPLPAAAVDIDKPEDIMLLSGD
ncbi:MAG: nucleotidyltransferase family protein [Gammaproteobacteria bacterium]